MLKSLLLALALLLPLADAFGGAQMGRESFLGPGEESKFRIVVDGDADLEIEKPDGWGVFVSREGKEYFSIGESYKEAFAYSIIVRPTTPSGKVFVTAIEKAGGNGISQKSALRFEFSVLSNDQGRMQSSIKEIRERVTPGESHIPDKPPLYALIFLVPLAALALRGNRKKSRFGIR